MNGLHVNQYPSGRWGFVGKVPADLAYVANKAEYVAIAQLSGPGIARKIAAREGGSFETRTWSTQSEAVEAALAAGYNPTA